MNKEFYESKRFLNCINKMGGTVLVGGCTRSNLLETVCCCAVGFKNRISDVFSSDCDLVYDFGNSFAELHTDSISLNIRCEHFFVANSDNTISYILSCLDNGYIYSVIYFVYTDVLQKLDLDYLLGRFFDFLGFSRYDRRAVTKYDFISQLDDKGNPIVETCALRKDAAAKAAYVFIDGIPSATSVDVARKNKLSNCRTVKISFDYDNNSSIPVTLLVNHGLDFFSSVDKTPAYCFNALDERYDVSDFDGALSTRTNKPIYRSIRSYTNSGWNYCYLTKIDIRDAVSLGCGLNDNSIPEIYGNLSGCIHNYDFSKTKFKGSFKKCLDDFLNYSPELYIRYALQVNTDILIYIARLNGINHSIPRFFTSRACDVAVRHLMGFFNCKTKKEYLAQYAGVVQSKGSLEYSSAKGYHRNSKYTAINADCEELQRFAALSYAGGYNGCFSVDCHHDYITYDLDISSAYPTAMCLVPALDYSNPIEKEYRNEEITLDEFKIDGKYNPMCPIFALITYEFPHDCLYPNLRRNNETDDEAPCYPLEESTGVYCSGPEIYLALSKGAKVFAKKGVKGKILRDNNDKIVYPYRRLVKLLVNARTNAEEKYGKGCLLSLYYKFIVNTLYGKIAQHVRKMYSGEKADYRESDITNNASASLITSFIRSVLFSAFDGIHDNGYNVYSATTDGLITDMPLEKFEHLSLYGFNDCLLESRRYITDMANPQAWSLKHIQDDLLNLTTRGNASLIVSDSTKGIPGGVIAKNGVSSLNPELPKEARINREAFILDAVSRTGKVTSYERRYTSLENVRKNQTYTATPNSKNISLDFDMKRKPIESTIKAEKYEINGCTFEIATFDTKPYADKEEYLLYKKVAERQKCLRTVNDMNRFFNDVKCEQSNINSGPREDDDYLFKKLTSCIMAYRAHEIEIPYLDTPGLTVKAKVAWIQQNNPSQNHTFTAKTWDKTSEKKRQSNRLPYEVIKDIYENLLAASPILTEEKLEEDAININVEQSNKEKLSNDVSSNISSVTVSTIREEPDRFLEINGVKMYFDDENEELLNESLNSPYFDNPYADDDYGNISDSHTFEIYDGEVLDNSDYDDDIDESFKKPDSKTKDIGSFCIGTPTVVNTAATTNKANNNNGVPSIGYTDIPDVDYDLCDDDYLPY